MFKIIGMGKFGTALHRCISDNGGCFSDFDYRWLIPAVPASAVREVIEKELGNIAKARDSLNATESNENLVSKPLQDSQPRHCHSVIFGSTCGQSENKAEAASVSSGLDGEEAAEKSPSKEEKSEIDNRYRIAEHVASLSSTGVRKQIKVLLVSKGMSDKLFLSELLESMGIEYAVLAGPHLADELGAGLPTRSTIATSNIGDFEELKNYFPSCVMSNNPHLVSLAGVFKNIVAFVCGMAEGLELGENARACIIQEAFAQLSYIALEFGFIEERLSVSDLLQPGIAGDLILTCNSQNSRNFRAGKAAARGDSVDFLVESAKSADMLIRRLGKSDPRWSIVKIASKYGFN